MSTQASRQPEIPLRSAEHRAFVALLRAHVATTRRLSSALENDHGLTLSDYEVLLHLAHAPDRMMRRVDLARSVLLTPSGITRLLDRLERWGYVDAAKCETDARVTYAHLTDAGHDKLSNAARTHVEDIRLEFAERFSADEVDVLGELLSRLESGAPTEPDCSP